jgi:hypothetical protein
MELQAILKRHHSVQGIGFAGKHLLGERLELPIEPTF